MKLCRFVLNDAPDQARSGIYHDGKIYETDGEKAIGIYDPGKLRLLTPIGTPPAIRVFQDVRRPSGEDAMTYRFQNVTGLVGANGELGLPPAATGLDFDLHVVGAISERAEAVELHEGASFVLGYAMMIVAYDPETAGELRALAVPEDAAFDFGGALGPYLTTPEDLTEFTIGSDSTRFEWRYRIKVNDVEVAKGAINGLPPFSSLLHVASLGRAVLPGELIAWPRVNKPLLEESPLGRPLVETDRIEAVVDGLGTLVVRIA